jgi:His/Glu/Gln/Arg/opine family amino acid ABC transporter permease subunit
VDKWNAFYKFFITDEGYLDTLTGLGNTILVAISGLVIGIFIGIIIAVIKLLPVKNKGVTVLKKAADIYVAFFRGTPIVVQLLLMYFVILPAIGLVNVPALVVGMIAFGFNSGAYVSEMMRGGILSVDSGQTEAGRTLGLSYYQTMKLIVLPQAIKNIIPMIGNEFIVLVKETSVLSFITILDLTKSFKQIGDANYEYIMPYLMLALAYLLLVFGISFIVKKIERRLRQSDRG